MSASHASKVFLSSLILSSAVFGARAGTLFVDDFDTDTSADWSVFSGGYTANDADYSVQFSYDYGAQGYKLWSQPNDPAPQDLVVPPAPNSNGTTKGLKLVVNKDAEGSRIAINLYPKGKSFSGDYVLKFDMFANHASWGGNGSGTTENSWFGINHTGTGVNWGAFSGDALRSDFTAPIPGADKSDGLFFTMTCDGGAVKDLWSLAGDPAGPPQVLFGADGGIPDLDGDGNPDHGDEQGNFQGAFTSPPFETPGVIGKRWVQVEVSQIKDVVTLKVEGHVMLTRTNVSAWKSGNIMIGYSDLFAGVAAIPEESWVLFDNVRVERARTVVVTTADNDSTDADGKTSLKEALAGLEENDTIQFNITGPTPVVIKTPLGGYPLIAKSGVTIDGFSQPGAKKNSLGVLAGSDARPAIVLDSTSAEFTGAGADTLRTSTRLPFPGYGDSENAILGVYGADFVTIRGLSFQSRHTAGSDEDPSIYQIALINQAEHVKIQGNWFGLAPDGVTVHGSASGVSAYRHRVKDDAGNNVDTFSGHAVIGTDSDGIDDPAEGNIFAGNRAGLYLELPAARISGNYFNLLPDGKTFLKVDDIALQQISEGVDPGDAGVENMENGRSTIGTIIGTDGNKVNDANEKNIFNHVVYDHLIEFYSEAKAVRIAGNYFGVAGDGVTKAVPSELTDGDGNLLVKPDLIEGPNGASFIIGSNLDGIGDADEGNLVVGLLGDDFCVSGTETAIVARGNTLVGNAFTGFPFADGSSSRSYEAYYAPAISTPAEAVPVLASLANNVVAGSFPLPTEAYPFKQIDFYVVDGANTIIDVIVPGKLIGTYTDNGNDDSDAALGAFMIELPADSVPSGSKVAFTVTYTQDTRLDISPSSTDVPVSDPRFSYTGPVSNALADNSAPAPIRIAAPVVQAGNIKLTWTGGTGPFTLQTRATLGVPWVDGPTTADQTLTVPVSGATGFYRISGK